MKKLITLLLAAFITTVSFSQEFKQGKLIQDKSFLKEWPTPIGVVDGDIYFMDVEVNLYKAGKVTLSKVDKNFNFVFKKELEFKVPNYTDYSIHVFNKKIYLFYTNPELVNVGYEYQVFDLDGNSIQNEEIGSLSIKGVDVGSNYNNFTTSPSGEYAAVVVGARRSNSDELTLNVMQLHLEDKVTVQKFETSINYKNYEVSKLGTVSLDDDGNIVGIVSKKSELSDAVDYEFDLFVLNQSKILKIQEVGAKGYIFRNFYVKINDNNTVKLWGNYYSKKDKKYYLNGFFIADYDLIDLDFNNVNFVSLSSDILKLYGEPNKKGIYTKFLGSFEVRNYENKDGSGYLVAERNFNYNRYYNYEILVLPYNKENEFSSYAFIPKNQKQTLDNYSSRGYFAFTKDNELNVFINARPDIVKATTAIDNDEMESPIKDKSKSYQIKVSPEGKRSIKVFEDNSATKRFIDISRSFNIDENHIMTMEEKSRIIYGKFE